MEGEQWAKVELMGHRTRVGKVSEVEMFGGKLMRIAALDDAGAARTCSTAFATASTVGQAGGVIDVASNLMLGLAPVQYDRSIGFKVAAAAATLVVGAKIQVAAQFLPVPQGVAFA